MCLDQRLWQSLIILICTQIGGDLESVNAFHSHIGEAKMGMSLFETECSQFFQVKVPPILRMVTNVQ